MEHPEPAINNLPAKVFCPTAVFLTFCHAPDPRRFPDNVAGVAVVQVIAARVHYGGIFEARFGAVMTRAHVTQIVSECRLGEKKICYFFLLRMYTGIG